MHYYVSKKGKDFNKGTKDSPFCTISRAAEIAGANDTITVFEGVYRESIKPKRGGLNNLNRITYEAALDNKVIIKGSEVIENWELVEKTIWKKTLNNSIFMDYNPFTIKIEGDWLISPINYSVHCGEVYLNGKALYETRSYEDLFEASNKCLDKDNYNYDNLKNEEAMKYRWFAVVKEKETELYCNFKEYNPNVELVEINVREFCFSPTATNINYITVKGFEFAHCASKWSPPTGFQGGMICANWSKGWVIENNIIHDSKSLGISLGKDLASTDTYNRDTRRKSGYQRQLECTFKAFDYGWSKENIGSHLVRNNVIYNCAQGGIAGNLGAIFSVIENNEIYNIGRKDEYFGYEISAIKLHAAIDVQIIHNKLYDSQMGLWLDWQAQGVRVNRNLFFNNSRDMMVEVSHGPYVIDNNILGSKYNFDNVSQGGAIINNIFCGAIRKIAAKGRPTPFHLAHSTKVAGFSAVKCGDDRVYNNLYVGGTLKHNDLSIYGTCNYDENPKDYETFFEKLNKLGKGDVELYDQVENPVLINNNAYYKNAKAYCDEVNNVISEIEASVHFLENLDGKVFMKFDVPPEFANYETAIIDSSAFILPRISNLPYEDPQGNSIIFEEDYFKEKRGLQNNLGPFNCLKPGHNIIQVW